MTKVFLSYAIKDGSPATARLSTELKRAGFFVWQDVEEMRGGSDWKAQIRARLRETDALLVLLTPGAIDSKVVTWEWETALTLEKKVIPLMLLPCDVPAELARLHYHRLHPPEQYVTGLMALIRDLSELAHCVPGAEPTTAREVGSTYNVIGATNCAIGSNATVINHPTPPQALASSKKST